MNLSIKIENEKQLVDYHDLSVVLETAPKDLLQVIKIMLIQNPKLEALCVRTSLKQSQGRPKESLFMELELAKRVAMASRSKKGEQVRDYFIAVEKEFLKKRSFSDDSTESAVALANHVLQLAAQNKLLSQKIIEIEPKAEGFDAFINSESEYSLNEAAKLLKIGQKTLISYLRDKKCIFRNGQGNWVPYQTKIDNGSMVLKTKRNLSGNGPEFYPQTFITSKGIEKLRGIFRKK